MKILHLLVTAVCAFLGGATFQLLDVGDVWAKGEEQPAEIKATKFVLVSAKGKPIGVWAKQGLIVQNTLAGAEVKATKFVLAGAKKGEPIGTWSDAGFTVRGSLSVQAEDDPTTEFAVRVRKDWGPRASWIVEGTTLVSVRGMKAGGAGVGRIKLREKGGRGELSLSPIALKLSDQSTTGSLWLGATEVILRNEDSKERLSLRPSAVALSDKGGTGLYLSPTAVALSDKGENIRLVLTRTAKRKPVIVFYDGDGNQVETVGGK